MNILYLGRPENAEQREILDHLVKEGMSLQRYGTVWRSVEGGVFERRKAVLQALREADAAIVDLSDDGNVPAGALVIGMATALDKRCVAIATNNAQGLSGTESVLRYSPDDSESMTLFMQQLIQRLQQFGDTDPTGPNGTASKVFISYSHQDQDFLQRLMIHLRPLEREGRIDPWSDRRIRPGDQWKQEIDTALDNAGVAILLISADFLASEFVASNELPPLLKKAQANGTRILPLVLKKCRYTRDSTLSLFQAVNDPESPLAAMQEWQREDYYDKVAIEVERLTNPPA